MLKLSIITVNFNNKEGLQKTIESVVNQTYKNYEYLVIDGGSTDGSVEVIKEYAEKISYWISESDNGIYNAMNKGILNSKGEYLQFLNSGDWLVNETIIENILHEIPNCDLLYGNMIMVMPNGKLRTSYRSKGAEISFFTLFEGTINHSPSFIKRSLFLKYGLYDEQLRIVSDWKFFLIAFGLNQSEVVYRNIDVNYFDMNGISNVQIQLAQSEREKVLSEFVPYPILVDFKKNKRHLFRLTLIRMYFITRTLNEISELFLTTLARILKKIFD